MGTRTIAVLVTIAFSVIGVLGDYFLKLASAREQPLRTGAELTDGQPRKSSCHKFE